MRREMMKTTALFISIILLTVGSTTLPGRAASTYKACSLLTAAELEGALRQKLTRSDDSDIAVTEGPYKGETVSICSWVLGSAYVTLAITRRPRTPQQRAAGLAILREAEETLKKQGWTIEDVTIGSAVCSTYRPPATVKTPHGAGCAMEAKSFAFSLGVFGADATPQQAKSLADRAAERLP